MRPRAIAAAVRFAVAKELPGAPAHVCPPCAWSHGSAPLTPAVAGSHAVVTLTLYELAIADRLVLEVRRGVPLPRTLEELDEAIDRATLGVGHA